MTVELKPCPFCGYDLNESEPFEFVSTGHDVCGGKLNYQVVCPFCECSTGKQYSEQAAVDAWNERKEAKE